LNHLRSQALEVDPAMEVAISNRPYSVGGRLVGTAAGGRGGAPGGRGGARGGGRGNLNPDAQLMGMFIETLGQEDMRRPRMDLGLGIWTATTRRYYPMDRIRERDGAFMDRLDGRDVLIYIDPETATPAALFVDAKSVKVQGKEVRLDSGASVRSGVLFDSKGSRVEGDRPQQIFTRWYGFALTFPGPEVFGQ
jgi:hypothetical protein